MYNADHITLADNLQVDSTWDRQQNIPTWWPWQRWIRVCETWSFRMVGGELNGETKWLQANFGKALSWNSPPKTLTSCHCHLYQTLKLITYLKLSEDKSVELCKSNRGFLLECTLPVAMTHHLECMNSTTKHGLNLMGWFLIRGGYDCGLCGVIITRKLLWVILASLQGVRQLAGYTVSP